MLYILDHMGEAETLEKNWGIMPWNVPQGITQK